MKIQPLNGIIQLKIDEAHAGALDLTSRHSAIEYGEVIAIGEGVNRVKVGDKVFFKAWAVDIINKDDVRYCFIAQDTNGLLAIVK